MPSVTLQASTPGTPDTGNSNISGTAIVGTSLIVNESTARAFVLKSRPSVLTIPVPFLKPVATDENIAFDIMPSGTATSSWFDACNSDMSTGEPAVCAARLGSSGSNVEIGARVYNGGTPLPVYFTMKDGTPYMALTILGNIGVRTTTATKNFQVDQGTTGNGTVSNGAGGTTVTGVGTQFLNTFKVGDTVTIAGQTVAISAIASDTSMTTAAITNANSNVAYTLTGGERFSVAGNGDVTATQFCVSALNAAPANSTDTGRTGEIRIVNGFIYVCVATNSWQRATLAAF